MPYDTLAPLIRSAFLQAVLPVEGDRILIRQEGGALMRPRPKGGELAFPVGSRLACGLVLEEAAYAVLCVVEPLPDGGWFCSLLEGPHGVYDGSRRLPATEGDGMEGLHTVLDTVNEEFWVETPGRHVILALICDQPILPGGGRLVDEAGYWERLAAWAADSAGVQRIRREFVAIDHGN